jgi:hypothetical protein
MNAMQTLPELGGFTYPELRALRETLYRATLRLYERATAIFNEMAQMATWTTAYAEMNLQAGVIMAAAGEQSALFAEVGAEMSKRDQAAL